MQFLRNSLLLFLLFVLPAHASSLCWKITRLHDRTQVIAEIESAEGIEEKSLIVLTDEKDKVLAIGRIRDIERDETPKTIKVDVMEVLENNVILVGDNVCPFSKEYLKQHKVPGFNSLTIGGKNEIEAKYKELAYFGVFTSDGHTLDEKEFLLSPFQLQYGVTDTLGLKIANALWLDGYVNAGLKFRAVHNKHAKITLNGFGGHKIDKKDWIAQGGGVITMPTNSKFQSHFIANFIFDEQSRESRATEDLKLYRSTDLKQLTEYITDDWNRVLFGPVYNVQAQTLGGTISYMWIWSMFHISLGVATNDFTDLSFGSDNGYYYVYDFFLRF